MSVTLYEAPLVIPVTGPVICDGAVAVRDGRVLHVGTRDWVRQKLAEDVDDPSQVELRRWGGLVTPGLVNAHTHLQYTGMASVGSRTYASFRDWELAFNKIYDSPEPKPWRQWAHDGARQMVESGTTAAADIVSDVEAADALASQGMHGIAYWEVMDWNNEDWRRKGPEDLLDQIHAIRAMGVTELGISPHAPYSLGSGPLLDLPDIARQLGMRLHIHLGETPAEAGKLPSRLTNQTSWAWNRTEWQSPSSGRTSTSHTACTHREKIAGSCARGASRSRSARAPTASPARRRTPPSRATSRRATPSPSARTRSPRTRASTSWTTSRSCTTSPSARATRSSTSRTASSG